MKALSEKQQTAAQDQLVRLLCFNCLPMLLALILLGWLSFGLPHPTWFLLFKTIFQADTLIAQQGMAFLLPLLILAVQSIFLLCAWGLLIWGITREVKTLIEFYSDVATLQTPSPSVATATPATPQPAYTPANPAQPYSPTPSYYTPAQSYAPPPPPPTAYNPFADEDDFPTDIIDMPTQLTTPPEPVSAPRYASYDLLTGANQRLDSGIYPPLEENAHNEEEEDLRQPRKRSTSIQKLSPASSPQQPDLDQEEANDYAAWNRPEEQATKYYTPPPAPPEDPLAATVLSDRSKMIKARNTEESDQTPPASSKRRPMLPAPEVQDDPFAVVEDDPFAVQDDVLHVFEQEDPQEQIQEADEQTSDDDPVFVYGNPFEGPLPDVFIHDEDLKRSIEEQNIALSDETASRPAVKKGNQKPTGIRKRS